MTMESPYKASNNVEVTNHSLQMVKYSASEDCTKLLSPCFDIRVFYVRLCGFQVDESTPKFLSLDHIPLSHDTLLEVNGVRSSMYLDGVSSLLRRDRVDKKSHEATFVNTDSIRLTGTAKFEVYDKDDCILSGVLEISNDDGIIGNSKSNVKRWSMSCETKITTEHGGFFKGKHVNNISEFPSPRIEVYVAGCFSRTPVILTKTLQLNFRKKHNKKCTLNAIPENASAECQKDVSDKHYLQVAGNRSFKPEHEEDYKSMYWQRTEYIDGEYGELSWYNAGVRVGVGIGLGICVGVGLGVGLLLRSYQATTRNFKRRFV